MMTTLKYTTAFIIQQRIIHPPRCRCPCPDMANTSRNPPAAVEVPPVTATAASAGTLKKTRKSTKQKNRNPTEFSDHDSMPFDQRKAPPRVLCHRWFPTHGKMLFGQLGLGFHNHPQWFVTRLLTHRPPPPHAAAEFAKELEDNMSGDGRVNLELTPSGKQEYTEIFDGLNYWGFTINVECRDAIGQRHAEECGDHSKGINEGIVLWEVYLQIRQTWCHPMWAHGRSCG